MKPHRILWLTENYPPQRGGMAQSCDRIVDGLRIEGYNIEIIHFVNHTNKKGRKEQINGGYNAIEFAESETHTLNLAWIYIQNNFDSFDSCVCFGGNLSMLAAPIFSKWLGVKLFTFIRGNDFDSAIFNARKRQVLQDALLESTTVFSVTTTKASKIKKWLPNVNVEFVANGIDLSQWRPTQSDLEFSNKLKNEAFSSKIVLGIFGQLKSKKGLDFLLKAIAQTQLLEKIHLLLIGDVGEEINNIIDNCKLSVTIKEFQDRYQLIPYYLACDALCIPSYYEGMPNVMLEAGALGVPIIASKIDGMADVVEDEKDGCLFEVGNIDSCKKVLYEFAQMGKEERSNMGNRLKQKIELKYTVKNEITSYTNFIR